MAERNDENLRALIRLIPPARALRKELEKMMNMELVEGIGEIAVRNFTGLLDSATKLVDDPYPATLAVELSPEASDKQKIAAVMLANSQLVAYLEAQAGVAGGEQKGSKQGDNVVVNLSGAKIGNLGEGFEKMGEMFSKLFGGTKFGEEFGRKFEEAFGTKVRKEQNAEKEQKEGEREAEGAS